jgi:Ca-activated chloride channel family protein
MREVLFFGFLILLALGSSFGQSGRVQNYSESSPQSGKNETSVAPKTADNSSRPETDDVIRVETDLVIIPAQITDRNGRPVSDIRREEFRIFENGVEQEIAYFSNQEQPFTVSLVLDMSYSSIFKLPEIQAAAFAFINQLRENDRVMVVSFDEKVRVLCEPTSNRKVLRLAIEGTRIASGTSLYTALDTVLNEKFSRISGRKAIVLLSDGVDTNSLKLTARDILGEIGESDTLVYPVQYDTYEDVQKKRKDSAQVLYDDDDRPYVVLLPKAKGEREEDYEQANEFLKQIALRSGGHLYRVSSSTNLNQAFAKIADELRKIYSLGYYPDSERKIGVRYAVNVRVYRANLKIHAKASYLWRRNPDKAR